VARPEKVAAVAEIRDRLTDSDAAVLTEYRGLKVSELAELRGALRPAGTDFKIFKNTLARRAAEEADDHAGHVQLAATGGHRSRCAMGVPSGPRLR